jgi:hypothetical protein
VFIYTREAHPGENVGHHDSFGRKLAWARLLAEEAGIGRAILVDDLDCPVQPGPDPAGQTAASAVRWFPVWAGNTLHPHPMPERDMPGDQLAAGLGCG